MMLAHHLTKRPALRLDERVRQVHGPCGEGQRDAKLVGHACRHDRREAPLRPRGDWTPSSSEPITRREPVPSVLGGFALLRLSPPYRAVSQGNWLVNPVKSPSPCGAP